MRRQQQSQTQTESCAEDCNSSPSQILERVQPDRVTVTKPEEDRRRRTIIVEKRNGSYGFTLQSYGIHYRREQEIEMITYVDYVDYDGPAYRAGMREGDVILSINGADMERADHKTLVSFIKQCDTRMRMVVLFEDCVRKVELHMRYIQLQRLLQAKMAELDRLCVKERQLLEGKWKTHSLPARRKASQGTDPQTPTQVAPPSGHCRPTVSTEDVARVARETRQYRQQPLVLAYQYLDTGFRYMIAPSTTSSGEYLLTFDPQYPPEPTQLVAKSPQPQGSGKSVPSRGGTLEKSGAKGGCHGYGGHLCTPCIAPSNNGGNGGDNTSLEAYDLASPCCDPHYCVPTGRRRSRHKDQRKRESKTEETQTEPSLYQPLRAHSTSQTALVGRRYGSGVVSQCSLYSCTSSEGGQTGVAPTTTGESSGSYTTSLSTDTLYWDSGGNRHPSLKHHHRYSQQSSMGHSNTEPVYVQYGETAAMATSKPKSWDNLATCKAIGGYGFGYGYLDTKGSAKGRSKAQYARLDRPQAPPQYGAQHGHRRCGYQSANSAESLLQAPKYSSETIETLTDSTSNSCECVDSLLSPLTGDNKEVRFFQTSRQGVGGVVSPTDPNFGYYSAARRPSMTPAAEERKGGGSGGKNSASNGDASPNSEATRL